MLKLQPVSGSFQTIRVGETFQPIWVRVTNFATPPNPVLGVPVTFQSMIFLPDADTSVEASGDDGSSQHALKVLLGSSQNTAITDANGLASLAPPTGAFSRPLEVEITASAGTGVTLQFELPMLSAMAPSPGGSTGRARAPVRLNARLNRGGERPHPNPQRFEDVSTETRIWNWSPPVQTTNYNVDCVPIAPKSDASESEPIEPKTSAKSPPHPAGPDQACEPKLSDAATQE